jgi:hypothetical protein
VAGLTLVGGWSKWGLKRSSTLVACRVPGAAQGQALWLPAVWAW